MPIGEHIKNAMKSVVEMKAQADRAKYGSIASSAKAIKSNAETVGKWRAYKLAKSDMNKRFKDSAAKYTASVAKVNAIANAAAKTEEARANAQVASANAALAQWNMINTMNPDPAEGTGDPSYGPGSRGGGPHDPKTFTGPSPRSK